ncbi:hypothetical protein G6F50_015526 [Rhizopus delemar]|uniref:Uncharacterized protein n=1 Tax=Rhizopus delemar TaxID=936053 RepID=A0A9P6XXB4_9FUNG|nr:hypothetical protein G6F50_015526 [Rhizopus delemar]
MQALHARACGTHARQNHPLRADQAVRITHQPYRRPQALERIAHRAQVGAAGIDQRDVAHNAPLVLGNAVPWRASAGRNARARALKQASTLW